MNYVIYNPTGKFVGNDPNGLDEHSGMCLTLTEELGEAKFLKLRKAQFWCDDCNRHRLGGMTGWVVRPVTITLG